VADLVHVPLNDLQPGDLLFYFNLDGDNAVDHVVMYVAASYGSSTVIAAAYTGTNIATSQSSRTTRRRRAALSRISCRERRWISPRDAGTNLVRRSHFEGVVQFLVESLEAARHRARDAGLGLGERHDGVGRNRATTVTRRCAPTHVMTPFLSAAVTCRGAEATMVGATPEEFTTKS